MKPFLILQLRPEQEASDGEFEAYLRFGGLTNTDVHRIDLISESLPADLNLAGYSGVIVGGGPGNVSDAPLKKDDVQKRYEAELATLLSRIVEQDIPYLGNCYGLGVLSTHVGGIVSKERYGEAVGAITAHLTKEGKLDPLTRDLPDAFRAFVGHKEACQGLPEGAVLLVEGETCPVQMMRIKQNVYGCQFHPELDVEGIVTRINVYKYAGYFPPEDAEMLITMCREETITEPMKILKQFVERYRS